MKVPLVGCLLLVLFLGVRGRAEQFIVLNLSHVLNVAPGIDRPAFERITREFKPVADAKVRVGVAGIFSYLHGPRTGTVESLRRFLRLSQEFDVPIVVQLDGENWWDARPDLWNWWDQSRSGYSPANRDNVEWTGWSPESAIKIAWRNWGRQLRVLPPPNLMSQRYKAACHEEMAVLIPIVVKWWQALPAEKQGLFIGLKVGWETSIGLNAWYYPNGNALLDQPPSRDPTYGLKADVPPARGVVQIGYAAVKTAGIRSKGQITEADLAEVARRHLEDFCREAARLGVPREKLFTHGAGWKEGELVYQAAVNSLSCPGWSVYRHAADPAKEIGIQEALKRSDAPYWAAVEWLYQGPRKLDPWRRALQTTLALPRCRYLCIYNWEGIRDSDEILEAIRSVAATSRRSSSAPVPKMD
jgi:hypothetical protein